MGFLSGKSGVIFGIANDRSIAWQITKPLHEQGAEMGFTHLPDRDPERPKNENKVRKLVEPIGAKFVIPCDVQKDDDLDSVVRPDRRRSSAKSTSCCTASPSPRRTT